MLPEDECDATVDVDDVSVRADIGPVWRAAHRPQLDPSGVRNG